ncbi:unnamed protein product [Rotaria magnacalcarata]|uniref:FLYWCH-type domain-containing protein n=4 Tax=Rotaria magnacalcarata TaxID=392030 RepID=A0A820AFV7_9BILA|nr:unnamed protein product [Rotaria magnacalcarata]
MSSSDTDETPTISFLISNKKKRLLVIDGYIYQQNKSTAKVSYWLCEIKLCNAGVHLNSDDQFRKYTENPRAHMPVPERLEIRKMLTNIKSRVDREIWTQYQIDQFKKKILNFIFGQSRDFLRAKVINFFRITPKFTVHTVSPTKITVQVTPTDPPALCEKSILPELSMALNYTWTLFDSNLNTISEDNNILPDSIYRICIKCRQTYSDPDGNPVCQEIKTLSKPSFLSDWHYLIFINIILILILFIIFGLVFSLKKNRYELVTPSYEKEPPITPSDPYTPDPLNPGPSNRRETGHSESPIPVRCVPNDDIHSEIFIINAETDLSLLTTNQIQTWLRAVSQINSSTQEPHIYIIRGGDEVEIPLYKYENHVIPQNRYLFKQNINKRVDCYLYENEFSSSIPFDFYDTCHGTLSLKQARKELAGIYVYAGNETSFGLGIIHVETTNSFQWFNGTKFYSFDNETNLKNGTQLVLGFETMLYYNENSDLTRYNTKINDIIQQANISIENHTSNNLEMFMSMEDLSCQRHQRIIHEDLRSLIFACTIKVTFKCSLQIGSTCWIENKHISNIRLNINSFTFITD